MYFSALKISFFRIGWQQNFIQQKTIHCSLTSVNYSYKLNGGGGIDGGK